MVVANATRERGYVSGFYGKWHLGSLSDRGPDSPDCYPLPAAGPHKGSCQSGYWKLNGAGRGWSGDACCFGTDDRSSVSNPLHFGFDTFVATPECAASATTNCGCFFWPTPHNDTPCELGHYKHPGGNPNATRPIPYLECMQYYNGTAATAEAPQSVEPLDYVSPIDDQDFLVLPSTPDGFRGGRS